MAELLTLGLREATSEVCVILSAHSLPLGWGFIGECLKPFENEAVAAARCVYVGKNADLTRWMEPEILDSTGDYISKGPLASGCVIRRSVWEQIPFDEQVEAAEEKLWTAEVLKRGYTVCSPCSAFYVYMKKMCAISSLHKNYIQLREIYRLSGAVIGFVNRTLMGNVGDLAKGLYVAPRAALDVIRRETLQAYYRFMFLIQARRNRKGEIGSRLGTAADQLDRR